MCVRVRALGWSVPVGDDGISQSSNVVGNTAPELLPWSLHALLTSTNSI